MIVLPGSRGSRRQSDAQPVAGRSHLGALDAVHVAGKVCSGQPVPFNCSRSAVTKAG